MTETQKRIEAYQKLLPDIKEKVAAVALLLALSVIMLSSASFAWLTISRRPEVTAVSTTVAANGNLEIALATGNGTTPPGESKVGDSVAAEDQTTANANTTWGNLINLTDPSYGLDYLILRPAQLNTASLLDSPLYGSQFGRDGRVTQLSSNFGYASWVPPEGEKPGYFGVSESFGVRAISSTKIEAVGAEEIYVNMVTKAKNQNLNAANMYVALGTNTRYMPSLATMMGLFMTARMNPNNATLNNPEVQIADIQNLRDMYGAFLDCFDAEAEAMASLVNLQLFLMHGENNYTPYTAEMIYATTTAKLKTEGIQITGLDQFIKDRNTIASDFEKLEGICAAGTSLKWTDSGISGIVNNLVDVGKCTIGADNTLIESIGASNAVNYLSGTQEAKITNGILYRFEERTGGYIEVKNLKISATVERKGITIPASVKANIQTTASRDYNLFSNDLAYAESLNDGDYKGGIPVAEDTYGLAVDFWVRTNAPATYLILEGNVLTDSQMVRATGKDANGNTVELYTVTINGTDDNGESFSYSMDLYQVKTKDESGKEIITWYNIDNHVKVTEEELNGATPLPKMVTVTTVTGYEGENRVWDDNQMMSVDATTQGSGSCYVYYADTPEDQARSLKLLEAFKVAFVGADGKKIATAIMDTEHFYAENGRVTVPLIPDPSDSINLGEDYEGNINYAITALEKNTPTRITAIVYLDGTKLGNEDVLSAADIQGQLNIQFGSSESLKPIGNEELEGKELKVSATVDVNSFDYDTATDMTVNVTVKVDGNQPSKVEAFFIRAISSTQGSRETTMRFTENDKGEWVSSYTFTAPGNYVLRSVQLDGVEYLLDSPPKVEIKGFAIETFKCEEADGNNHVNVMTAENSKSVKLSMKFVADDDSKMPSTVRATYIRDEDGSAVNAEFTYNPTTYTWNAEATFRSSGDYTLQYVYLDNKITELDESFWQTASVTLGMKVAVYTTSPHTFKFEPSEWEKDEDEDGVADGANKTLLGMQIKIMDNTGKELLGLSDVKLIYGMKGSGIKTMDTDLEWNGDNYVGELTTTGPGIWQFSKVTVGSNILTMATTPPIFTILSPEPPEYVEHKTSTYQYAPSNNATMNVVISNSSAAAVQAYIIKDGATEGTWVDGVISNEITTEDGKTANNWNFAVPKDTNGYQDGNWTLTQLKLWDVFAADGTAYTEEAPLEIDVSDTNNVSKVVSRVFITFAENKSADFGKDASGNVTGVFMQDYNISGIKVKIHDFENQKIDGISDVKLEFTYGNNSKAYGGYSGPTNATADFTIPLTGNDGINFSQAEDYKLRFAGSYTTKFSFIVNGKTTTYTGDNLPTNAPVYTVSSVAPSITLAGRTNYDGSSVDGNTITVTYNHSTETRCGITYHNYAQASVTLELTGYGNASGATLTFTESNNGDVHLYVNSQDATSKKVNNFSWTGDGDCLRWVGYWDSQTGSDRATAAGTIKATQLVLTYDNMTFTVDIDDITIINPTPPA